ncbi:hypothetical protein HFN89_03385 [Rhizobium laguerreae]|nr:hypothetical protein [Rhizobium laguerreae]
MYDVEKNKAVAKKWGTPETTRWMDVTAAGMRMYLAVYKNGRRLVMENGDKMPEAMEKLNFQRAENGYWYRNEFSFQPNDFKAVIPSAVTRRDMPIMDVLLDLTELAPSNDAGEESKEDAALATMTKQFEDTAPAFLGFNRSGDEVYENSEGVRHLVSRKRSVVESTGAASVPSHYLRAPDNNQLAACADGYIVTLETAANADFAKPTAFMKALELDPVKDAKRFAEAVSAAAVRHITKDSKETLTLRYEKACRLSSLLKSVGLDIGVNLESMILARRLMGTDKDLRGESVFRIGGAEGLFEKVLPATGCRRGENPPDASIVVNFASSAKELADTLDARPAKTKSILVLDVDSHKKARTIVDAVAENNHIEGAGFLSAAAGGPRLILSVISTEQPSGEFTMTELASAAEAWTWSSMVAKERSHAIETFKAGLATDSDFNAASSFVFDNSYQVPYNSASKVGNPTTLVPKELSAATRIALDRIISNYRDIDEKVAYECGFPKEELGRYLAAEQVDGVALLINAEERGRGAVIGDGTGVGKGRQLMAMVRRAVLKGQRVLIFSESAANLADLMRDAKHLDSLDKIKPLVLNSDKLIDEVTKEEFETLDRSLLDKAIENGEWPEGVSVIMATYSQFNKDAENSAKSLWLRKIVDERVSLFGDEIHNAASLDSNVSINYSYIKQNAATCVSASATYAKEAKNMAFFREMFPSDIDMAELQAMMQKGGEPFQEVVSDMLTADGVFFRRETDLSEIEFIQLIDSDKVAENRIIADKLSIIVSEMAKVADDVGVVVDAINRANNDGARRGNNNLRKSAIGSSLYHITRLLNAALVAPYTADKAIEELKAGNKPGFLLENTVGELLEEARLRDGEQPTFRHVLHRALDQMVGAGKARGKAAVVAALQPAARESYDRIFALIEDFPEIPASVIDTIKNRITAAGYTIGEITGRSLEVNAEGKVVPRKERNKMVVKNAFNSGEYDCVIMNATGATGMDLHAGRRFKDRRRRVLFEVQGPANVLKQIQAYGRYSRRDQESAPKIAFVGTGLPFESRLAAMRNQKLRRLSANVQSNRDNSFLMGNIPDLINSVGDAVITKYAELRPDLLRRLVLTDKYANRTKLVDVADETAVFKNEPERATELAVIEPDQQQQRQQAVRNRPGLDNVEQRTANEFLSRLSLLPCREQDRILHELTAEYEMHIAELDSLGVNPLRPREFDGTVQVRNSKLFEGSIDNGANSAFESPMFLMEALVEREVEPMRSEVVVEALEASTPRYDRILGAVNEVVRNRDRYLAHYLQDGHLSVDDAIARGDAKIASMAKDIAHLKMAIDAFMPGRQITFVNADGVAEKAIIASVEAPWEGSEHLIASYRMKIAVAGTEKLKEYGVETVLRNNGVSSFDKDGKLVVSTSDGLLGNDYEKILDSFDKASRKRLQNASFLVGNVFRAVRYATQFRLGSLVSFVDHNGFRHRGVLINRQAEKKLNSIAVRVEGIEAAAKALAMNIEINSSPTGTGRNLVITPLNDGTFAVRLPEPYVRGKVKQWPSDGYRELYETMIAPDVDVESLEAKNLSRAKIKQAIVPRAIVRAGRQLENVLQIVSQAGFRTFYVDPKHRAEVGDENTSEAKWEPEGNGVKA